MTVALLLSENSALIPVKHDPPCLELPDARTNSLS